MGGGVGERGDDGASGGGDDGASGGGDDVRGAGMSAGNVIVEDCINVSSLCFGT